MIKKEVSNNYRDAYDVIHSEILPRMSLDHQPYFLGTIPDILKFDRSAEVWKEISGILNAVPETWRGWNGEEKLSSPDSFYKSFTKIVRYHPSVKALRIIGNTIEGMPEHYRSAFLEKALPAIIRRRPSEERLEETLNILGRISKNTTPSSIQSGVTFFKSVGSFFNKHSFEEFRKKAEMAEEYLRKNKGGYFFNKVMLENFSDLSKSRLNFKKTGGELVPLGKNLTNKIARVVNPEAFEVWKELYEDKNLKEHVEPILEKNGVLRAFKSKEGVRVFTRYVGIRVDDFKKEHPEHAKEVDEQVNWIKQKLWDKGIRHGHIHPGNLVVEMVKGKPNVRLIDFDAAGYYGDD